MRSYKRARELYVRAFGEGGEAGRVKEGADPGARIWRSRAGSREACERGLEW